MAIFNQQTADVGEEIAFYTRGYMEDKLTEEQKNQFCIRFPQQYGRVAESHARKVKAKAERDFLDDCLSPCPPDRDSRTWHAERTNRLLAAILEKLNEPR